MKENKFLIAVGYPIGIFPTDEESHFKIEFNNSIYGIGKLEYVVWELGFTLQSVLDAIKKFKEITNKDSEVFFSKLENLIENGLILELDYFDLQSNIEKISNFKFIRQGLGNGIVDDSSKNFNINLGSDKNIDLIKYLIWMRGNGEVELREIIKEFIQNLDNKNEDIEALLIAILQLYKENLIIFKG